MNPSRKLSPLSRPRAPILTVDVSAAPPEGENVNALPTPKSSTQNDSNTLAVPTIRSKADSWYSPGTTCVASDEVRQTRSAFLDIHKGNTDVLQPDPGDEALFTVQVNPFAFSPGQLGKLINPKSLAAFVALGGLSGVEKGLQTHRRAGLNLEEKHLSGIVTFEQATSDLTQGVSDSKHGTPLDLEQSGDQRPHHGDGPKDSFIDRTRVFGDNRLPDRKSKSFLQLAWIALQDRVLILLSVAAVVSLALGLYQTFGQAHHSGAKVEWVEGVAIIVAITIVVLVGALNDWQKERQFKKLNAKKEQRLVKVVRSGKPATMSVYDILVGDVLLLEPGDVIPVDGVLIDGHNVSCDESSATGESDLIKKVPADTVLHLLLYEEAPKLRKLDPFIISGAKVLDGVGSFLVTAVGKNSSHGRTMMSLRDDPGLTPLQSKLNVLAGYIAKLGTAAGGFLFFVLFIEFLVRLRSDNSSPEEKGQSFLQILITSITIIVVAVPEGLPLAVTLSLAFATKKMAKANNLVRHLQSCETMGNATVICSDKTGTLTENVMTVVAGSLGKGGRFLFGDANNEVSQESHGAHVTKEGSITQEGTKPTEQISMSQLSSKMDTQSQDLLKTAISVNTTAFEGEENGKKVFIGTKTESALLDWVRRCFALGPLEIERANHPVKQLFPFNSKRKCMGAVIQLKQDGNTAGGEKYRLFIKGAPEIVLAQCASVLDDPTKTLFTIPLSDSDKKEIGDVIFRYATQSLRTLGLAYRDFEQWPPEKAMNHQESGSSNMDLDQVFQAMTWIGVVGIQDPVRKGVLEAVQDCHTASVSVKMVTGDNVETARAIARECGILTQAKEGLVIEGLEFRQLSETDRATAVKDLCVLARSSPEDKRVLVKTLRSLGEIVAVTGDGTNDAPAIKAADVGFSMGITGTEVAKEASDIILMDDNFSSIVRALSWGRAINDSVKKFLQFQLTVNITAVIITFVSAVSDDEETSVLNAVQLLWVNLIMDTFAALALATDPPTGSLLHRKPELRNAPLITLPMWKMIIGQSIFQLIVCFVLLFAGPSFLGYPEAELRTLIFNVFVFMQIFKLINSRRIDNRLNIFEGLHRNHLFMLMMSIMVGGQLIIIFLGGDAFVVVKLNGAQWAISVIIGFCSIPIGVLIRLFPDSIIEKCGHSIKRRWPTWLRFHRKAKNDDELPPGFNAQDYDIDAALFGIRDDLEFLTRVRGGRIRMLSEAMAKSRELMLHPQRSVSRSRSRSRRGSPRPSNRPPISPMMSVVGMPGIVAASVGGLSPVERPVSR
ncbi:hypothetical protein EDB81DRAFT_54451 [Dactylonectria macrodidyma]|uniref:Calcium-transporting ATPase n=1 Tax=Dactylonectria macrodidyma TaxID=307937 RepID=A0A9P9J4T9_9HYPO|nr:hypothetical protein EDB81DRAFT_54451 [Dactylonectria macrodidyma]